MVFFASCNWFQSKPSTYGGGPGKVLPFRGACVKESRRSSKTDVTVAGVSLAVAIGIEAVRLAAERVSR